MKRRTHILSLVAALGTVAATVTGCDMMLDSAMDPSVSYSVGVASPGVSVNVGSSLWSPGWNSPFWTYPVYRPAYVPPPTRPIYNPIPPTRPGGNFRPSPPAPAPSPSPSPGHAPTPPASGQRPGAH